MTVWYVCEDGHEVSGNNVKVYAHDGKNNVTCRECSSAGLRVNKLNLGDTCRNGHLIAGDNAEEYTENGSVYIRCAECFAYRNAAKANPGLTREQFSMMKDDVSIKPKQVAKKGNVSYAGLNYLKLSKRAQRAWEPLENAFDQTRGLCYGNSEEFIDYDEYFTPTPMEAYRMCEGCPILVECGRFANAYKPIIGVWGGSVWQDGRIIK